MSLKVAERSEANRAKQSLASKYLILISEQSIFLEQEVSISSR
jgi:hypothetical protein